MALIGETVWQNVAFSERKYELLGPELSNELYCVASFHSERSTEGMRLLRKEKGRPPVRTHVWYEINGVTFNDILRAYKVACICQHVALKSVDSFENF